INSVELPEAQVQAEAALILPAQVKSAKRRGAKAARKVSPKRGQKTRRRKTVQGKARKGSGNAAMKPAPAVIAVAAEPAPAAPLADQTVPRSRAIVPVHGGGIVNRLVRWLDAISFVFAGKVLPRRSAKPKRRREALPLARQASTQPAPRRRKPPPRQPAIPGCEAGDELARLRAENARLKARIAQLCS
ncbi:MAG: hypothetical protein ACKOPQ_16415, partial [Novosphingobium sp.]